MARALTTFGVGADITSLTTDKPVPAGIVVQEVAVPDGVDPSKFGTWAQRAAVEGVVPPDIPEVVVADVKAAAALLADHRAIALDMTGTVIGGRMAARMGAGADEPIWFVTALVPDA
jgi:hypothetical protein